MVQKTETELHTETENGV